MYLKQMLQVRQQLNLTSGAQVALIRLLVMTMTTGYAGGGDDMMALAVMIPSLVALVMTLLLAVRVLTLSTVIMPTSVPVR